MEFDPSIISQIPDMAPNPMRAKEAGYRLADLIDTQQLNRLKLNTAKTAEADQTKAKHILKGADYSTPEGITKTAEKLSRAGLADQAMEFMKTMQGLQSTKGQLTKQQYEILSAKNDLMGNTAASLASQYDALVQRGIPDAQARGMMQPKYQEALQQLGQTKLPDGSSALSPQDLQQIQGNPQFNPDFVRTIAERSKEGAAALKAQLEFHRQGTLDKQADTAAKTEAEREKHDRAMEERSGKPPSGFEWDPDKPGEQRPIKGGPKDPNSKPWSGREKVFSERILTSANEAARAVENITELPVGASSGVLGIGGSAGTSLLASAKGALTNELASQDVQDYNTMLAGVRRNLATIESTGLAPSGALTEGFGSLELRSGDTNLTKLRKLAEMRQIVDAGLEVQLADPAIPDSIKELMRVVVTKMAKAVPYTQQDVTLLRRAQQRNPEMTLETLIGNQGLRKTPATPAPTAPAASAPAPAAAPTVDGGAPVAAPTQSGSDFSRFWK